MNYEKFMNRHVVRLGFCLFFCMLLVLFARLRGGPGLHHGRNIQTKTERHFDNLIVRTELAVVLFYEKDKMLMKHNTSLKNYVEQLERLFDTISKVPKYKEAGIYFMKVNVARKDLDDVGYNYQIGRLPTVMLFEDGIPLKKEGNPVEMIGELTFEKLRAFIDEHFKSRIEDILADKAQAREQAARDRMYAGPYWGWGWGGYPYYYWNYPYYGSYGPWWW